MKLIIEIDDSYKEYIDKIPYVINYLRAGVDFHKHILKPSVTAHHFQKDTAGLKMSMLYMTVQNFVTPKKMEQLALSGEK